MKEDRAEAVFEGYSLVDILVAAGINLQRDDIKDIGIKLSTVGGWDTCVRLENILNDAWYFDEGDTKKERLPALIVREDRPGCSTCSKSKNCNREKKQWTLVFGQRHPKDRVRRKWVHAITEIEILNLRELLGSEVYDLFENIGNDGFRYSCE